MENDEIATDPWPDLPVPADVPRDESAPASTPAAAAPATPPATPPAGGTPPAQPPATPPATPQGGAPAGQPSGSDDVIPKYRLDEQRAHFESVIADQTRQIQTLTDLVQRAIGGGTATPPATPATPPVEEDPRDVAVRERLYAVIPGLKRLDEILQLADQKDRLLGTADAVGRYTQAETQYYDRYAERTLNSIFDKIASFTLGEGKVAKDVDDLVKSGVLSTFTRWVTKDPARAARYEAEDPKIVEEFWTAYKAAVYDPVRRDSNAAVLQAAATPPAVPVGGGGAPVASTTPPKLTGLNEDDVHAAAWARRDSVGV